MSKGIPSEGTRWVDPRVRRGKPTRIKVVDKVTVTTIKSLLRTDKGVRTVNNLTRLGIRSRHF